MWSGINDVFSMQEIYEREISVVVFLQTGLFRWRHLLVLVSRLGNPCNYTIIFPVVYHMKETLGLKLLLTAVFTQFIGLVIKWFVGGHRPYWWIHIAHPMENISVDRFNVECDSTPGGISSHVLVTSAVVVLFILNISSSLEQSSSQYKLPPKGVLWTVGIGYLLILSTSQLFIAADFPHQVTAGLVTGIFFGILTQKFLNDFKHFGLLSCSFLSGLVTFLALMTYGNIFHLLALKELPFRGRHTNNTAAKSVRNAKRWCVKPSFLVEEHFPFCQMVAIAGLIFGFGLAIHFHQKLSQREIGLVAKSNGTIGIHQHAFLHNGDKNGLTLGKMAKIIFSLIFIKIVNLIPLPRQLDVYNYYTRLIILLFFKNFILAVTMILFIPHFTAISTSNWASVIPVNFFNYLIRSCKRCGALIFKSSILDSLIRIAR